MLQSYSKSNFHLAAFEITLQNLGECQWQWWFVHNPYIVLKSITQLCIYGRNLSSKIKIARITPIYKSGAKEEINNYRPISILTCFSKIIEKILFVRPCSCFKKHNVINKNQYGFQSNISTSQAMLDVVTSSYDNIDHQFCTGLAFVDLKKAFDTVSHNIPLTKLNNYGIRGIAYTIIRSYLDNRQQFVSINQSQSNLKPIRVGVPQGSSLSPMFFLISINDLHNSVESEPRLFADDTCLLVKGSNSEQLETNLNAELHHLHLWFSVNKLSVNPAKTNIVIIPPKPIKAPISHLNISSNGTPVNIVSCAKYLGVIIGNELDFHDKLK